MSSRDDLLDDQNEALAHVKEMFYLPENTIYLDGNSLGPLLKRVESRIQKTVREEWGQSLISSWNNHGWIDLSLKVGEKIAPLVGAAAGQVICADSVSINLFKLLVTSLQLNLSRIEVLSVEETFPTDLYMVQGLQKLLGDARCSLRSVNEENLVQHIDESTNLVMISHVNFRNGYVNDLKRIVEAAHAKGAMVLADLSHSAGVLPIQLDAIGVDFAVGCGYKFLNGGPGAPAFLYVNARHHDKVEQPLSGWMGHSAPFDFSSKYLPKAGIGQYLSGTPGIIGLSALDEALTLWADIDIADVRIKSIALTDMFIAQIQASESLNELMLISPEESAMRGSQVSLSHRFGYEIVQALIAAGVVCDYREPDILRFGFSPLYNSFEDVSRTVDLMQDIVKNKHYKKSEFGIRNDVT